MYYHHINMTDGTYRSVRLILPGNLISNPVASRIPYNQRRIAVRGQLGGDTDGRIRLTDCPDAITDSTKGNMFYSAGSERGSVKV